MNRTNTPLREKRLRSVPRPKTLSPKELRRLRRRATAEPTPDHDRPTTRSDCKGGPRPCPFVGCRHHLFLEVKPSGAITVSRPHLEPWEIPESCALDVAERGGHTLDEIGELLNLSWERVRKLETQALGFLRVVHGAELAPLLFHSSYTHEDLAEELRSPEIIAMQERVKDLILGVG